MASPMTGKGIIERENDVDVFKFNSPAGQLHLSVKSAQAGPNLWVRTELWSATDLIAVGHPGFRIS